jgi:hypothetical protein
MTAGRYVFYALVWKYHWRLIQKSNYLSSVMAYRKKKDEIEYIAVDLSLPIGGPHPKSGHRDFVTVWQKVPGTLIHSIAGKCQRPPNP